MSGDFKATPFARLFFWHFLKGFSREIDHLSLVDFFTLQNFSKKQITYAFRNELPNWKRIHKGTFPPKKNTYVFPNELPNWKRILKGKNGKKGGKKVGVLYCGGVLLLWTGSWRTLLRGGLLTPCEHYIVCLPLWLAKHFVCFILALLAFVAC